MKCLNSKIKNNKGFTLIELIIVVVIIGILAAVAVPMYTRQIITAKAAEAQHNMTALVTYVQGYIRAHPNDWSQSEMLTVISDSYSNTGWVEDVIGDGPADVNLFRYRWYPDTREIRVYGRLAPFVHQDRLFAAFSPDGKSITWSAQGRLMDINP